MKHQRNHDVKCAMKKIKLKSVLAQLLKDRGLSAREVARKCSIPQSTFNNYLSGRGPQNPEQILELAQYFGCSMEFLLFGEDLRPPTMDEILTEGVFEGWLKVKIERAIPNKRKAKGEQ